MSWAPVQVFDCNGERMYSEMNTASWWWEQQLTLPVGTTLLPVLLASDQTHLTNFSGDKKLWPVYMSIANISSTIRNKPSSNAWIPIALLPIPPKRLDKLPDYPQEEQELDALQVTHDVISLVLSPLADARSLEGIEMVCCDEKIRKCIPKLSAWLADHVENCNLHGVSHNQCAICIASTDQFGELPDQPFTPRPHATYATAYRKLDAQSLREYGVKNINNALWHLTNFQPHDLIKPHTLHTLYLGILTRLMKWVRDFLNHVGRLTIFDYLWSRLPPFPGFTRPTKAYRSVSQWTGKEMRNLLRVILGVFTASLSRTSDVAPLSPRNKPLAHKAILCVRYITDFIILAQYKIHTTDSIKSMNDYLQDFHKYKEVFLQFRANKAAKTAARGASQRLRSDVNSATSDAATPSKRRKLTQDLRIEKEEMIHELLTENAHFNFPKMHLISYFAAHISKYGSLPQYSTEICEASHKPLKDAYRRSNHINAMPQIIETYTRSHSFAMRENNIAQWAKELEHIPADISGIPRPTPLRIHIPPGHSSILTKRLQGRMLSKTIYNPATLATNYELPDLQALTIKYLIHNTFKGFPNPDSDAARFINAPLEAFHTLQVPVQTFDNDGHIIHRVRCTGPNLFRKTEKRHDWIFVRRRPSSPNKIPGSLDGRVPAQLNALFKLRDTNAHADRCHLLAHISLTKVVGSQAPDGPEGMCRVGTPMTNHVIRISDIEGMAHLIPIEPDRLYLVNNRIDQHTWNEIHDGN